MPAATPILQRHRWIALGILATGLLGPTPARSEHPATPYTGDWQHAGGAAERQQLARAIDHSVAQMNFLLRGLARSRMTRDSEIPEQLRIETHSGQIAIAEGQLRRLASEPGRITHTLAVSGDSMELLHEVRTDALIQHRATAEGDRRTTYRLRDQGSRLVVEVVTTSRYLPTPLVYHLTFERVPAPMPAAGSLGH